MSGLGELRKAQRKVFTPIEVEREARLMLMEFFQDKFPELKEEWFNLNASEKWNVAIKMLPYIAPKLSSVVVKGDGNNAISLLLEMAQGKAKAD